MTDTCTLKIKGTVMPKQQNSGKAEHNIRFLDI